MLIGAVGVDLPGADQKPLSGPQMVPVGHAIGIIGHKQPLAGDHVMEQIVIADKGAIGMERFALFPAVLEEAEVEKVVIGKHGKGIL